MIVKRTPTILLLAVGSACLLYTGCRKRPAFEQTWLPMGTFATITIPGSHPHAELVQHVHAVTSLVHDIEFRMSAFEPGSDVCRLNAAAGGDMIPIDRHTARTLALSIEYAALSGGAFDPTVAPLVDLWGFNHHNLPAAPPSDAQRQAMLPLVGADHIVLSNRMAALPRPGMQIDLGGIAKGYAVDQAYDLLTRRNVHHFLVNIGGNLRVRGTARPDKPWTIGVRDPFDRGRILGTLKLPSGMALATSGNYERFVTIAGRRYAHIIDPRTGRPVEGMAGVTVLCPSAAEADALSTALFVLGRDDTHTVLNATPDSLALWVPDVRPLRILMTPGMANRFTPHPALADSVTIWSPDPERAGRSK